MAVVTAAQLQTVLGTTGMNMLIVRDASITNVGLFYVEGMVPGAGRARWCRTDPANENTLTQAASISSAMVA